MLQLGLVHLLSPILPAPQAVVSSTPKSKSSQWTSPKEAGGVGAAGRGQRQTGCWRGPTWGLLGSSSPRKDDGMCP